MSPKLICRPLGLLLAAGLLAGAAAPAARADDDCGAGCGATSAGLFGFHCPRLHFCCPRPPKICWHPVCLKPICCPGELEHYGYWQTCWHPWPFPPDWSHCPVPPSEVAIFGGAHGPTPPLAAPAAPSETLPTPHKGMP
jgi:hypothetical protein